MTIKKEEDLVTPENSPEEFADYVDFMHGKDREKNRPLRDIQKLAELFTAFMSPPEPLSEKELAYARERAEKLGL